MTQIPVLLALTGLRVESEILETASSCEDLNIVCAASDPGRARSLFAAHYISAKPARLLSFGIAGGLAPELPAGSIVIADQVMVGDTPYRCDEAWVQQLSAALPQARVGSVQGATAIVATLPDKHALFQQHQALVCDMESPIVAEAAMASGLPFACLRVVCDPADFALPPAALLPLKDDGAPQLSAVVCSLLQAPGQLPALLALRRHYRKALHSLDEAARVVV